MKFLIVDDAPEVVEAVSICLEVTYPGATIISAAEGSAGLELASQEDPDLVILDIGLPNLDGFEVCRQLKANSQVPVIILTGRDRDTDVARGLVIGADDYITKPFSHIDFLARVKAVLRRTEVANSTSEDNFREGVLYIDFDTREMCLNNRIIKLAHKENSLLYELVRNSGETVNQCELLDKVWGLNDTRKIRCLRTCMNRLRQKLVDLTKNPRIILTEPGEGYLFSIRTRGVKSSRHIAIPLNFATQGR